MLPNEGQQRGYKHAKDALIDAGELVRPTVGSTN